jgi:hypothetical protein
VGAGTVRKTTKTTVGAVPVATELRPEDR